MQYRPSDTPQHFSPLALILAAPSRADGQCGTSSVPDASGLNGDDGVIGTHSRAFRIEQISRALSVHVWSGMPGKSEDLDELQSAHWLRVDDRHGTNAVASTSSDQPRDVQGSVDTLLGPEFEEMLCLQGDVGFGRSEAVDDIEQTRVLLIPQLLLNDQSPGVVPSLVCGLTHEVNDQVCAALGIDVSTSASRVTTKPQSAVPSRIGKLSVCLAPALDGESGQSTVSLPDTNEVPRDLSSRGPMVGSMGPCLPASEVWLENVSDSGTLGRRPWIADGLTRGRCQQLDCANSPWLATVPAREVLSKNQKTGPDSRSFGEFCLKSSEYFRGARDEVVDHAFVKFEQLNDRLDLCSSKLTEIPQAVSLELRLKDCWFQQSVGSVCEYSVRWLVGNLLLDEQSVPGNVASGAIRSVTETIVIGVSEIRSDVAIDCGGWIECLSPLQSVDTEFVALQLSAADLPRVDGRFVVVSMGCAHHQSSVNHEWVVSATNEKPRCLTRVAAFRYTTGGSTAGREMLFAGFDVLLASDQTGRACDSIVNIDRHDVVTPQSTIRPVVSWVHMGGFSPLARRSEQRFATAKMRANAKTPWQRQCSCWDGATTDAHVVRDIMIEAASGYSCACCVTGSMTKVVSRLLHPDLSSRIWAGPVFSSGLENFGVRNSFVSETCEVVGVSSALLSSDVARLDRRFLKTGLSLAGAVSSPPQRCVVGGGDQTKVFQAFVDVGLHEAIDAVQISKRDAWAVQGVTRRQLETLVGGSEIAMRPPESRAAMQSTTQFFFRHRVRSATLSEHVSDVFAGNTSASVRTQLFGCGMSSEVNAIVGPCEAAVDAETVAVDVVAILPNSAVLSGQVGQVAVVVSVGSILACTLTHVPQYCNRASWNRAADRRLVDACGSLHVAENYFPPLSSFELPRLVLADCYPGPQGQVDSEAGMRGFGGAIGGSMGNVSVGNVDPKSESGQFDLFARVIIAPRTGKDVSELPAGPTCSTGFLLGRMRSLNMVRKFTDPLRNYLKANWSLTEVLADCNGFGTPMQGIGSRFLVMTDKRAVGQFTDGNGTKFCSEQFAQTVDLATCVGFSKADRHLMRYGSITNQSTHVKALVQEWDDRVWLGKGPFCETPSTFVMEMRTGILRAECKNAYVNQGYKSAGDAMVLIDFTDASIPSSVNELNRFITDGDAIAVDRRLSAGFTVRGACEVISTSASASVGKKLTRSILDGFGSPRNVGTMALGPNELQQSIESNEVCRYQTCSKQPRHRAA